MTPTSSTSLSRRQAVQPRSVLLPPLRDPNEAKCQGPTAASRPFLPDRATAVANTPSPSKWGSTAWSHFQRLRDRAPRLHPHPVGLRHALNRHLISNRALFHHLSTVAGMGRMQLLDVVRQPPACRSRPGRGSPTVLRHVCHARAESSGGVLSRPPPTEQAASRVELSSAVTMCRAEHP